MRRLLGAGAAIGLLVVALPAFAEPTSVEPPVLHAPTPAGTGTAVAAEPAFVTPSVRVIDGSIDDWIGAATGFGGASVRSAGELIYTDHLFDAYGADDGADAERLGRIGQLSAVAPGAGRLEPLFGADVPGEVGVDDAGLLSADDHYGNAERQDTADLFEVRVAPGPTGGLDILARTTTMNGPDDTAVLVLLDTAPGASARDIPFGSGIRSERADVAVLLANGAGEAVDLATGDRTAVAVAVDPSGYTNAIEAAIPGAVLTGNPAPEVAVASGAFDAASGGFIDLPGLEANLANVAFRSAEPVSTWFDQQQALALLDRSIDGFFVAVDTTALAAGVNERYVPGPGYHDRTFASSETISNESGTEGIHQHYGLFIPTAYDPGTPDDPGTPAPLTFWLHWRGGKAHSAATIDPRIFLDQGEAFDGIVVAPRGRGSSTWYLGRGLVDVNEVFDDARATLAVDENRVYVSGHSMGGWGSYLLPLLYPDRFAGAFPVAGPVTQGAWTGLDFEGCDDFAYDEYTPCYVSTDGSDPRAQHTRPLLENLRNVPIAIYQGAIDELVPTSGVTRQVERLVQLGYRHRYYVFPNYEHYSHPVHDEWIEGARYVHGFVRDPNPARVSYVRDLVFEGIVETGPSRENPISGISFDFDRAYWMSELTPVDPVAGVAHFEGRTLARPDEPSLRIPEAGGPSAPGQIGPFVMTGLAYAPVELPGLPPLTNAFELTLTGTAAVRLDLGRMAIDPSRSIAASVTSDAPLTLRLAGGWVVAPVVTVNGVPVAVQLAGGVLTVPLPAGASNLTII